MSFDQCSYEQAEEEIRKAFAEKDAEIERLRAENEVLKVQIVNLEQNAKVHDIEDEFYKLAILERDSAWREIERLKNNNRKILEKLSTQFPHLCYIGKNYSVRDLMNDLQNGDDNGTSAV